jgi:hypothetical protein
MAPYAFKEQGVTLLSSVLHSDRAGQVNIKRPSVKTLSGLDDLAASLSAGWRRHRVFGVRLSEGTY